MVFKQNCTDNFNYKRMPLIWFGNVSIHLLYIPLYPCTLYLQMLFAELHAIEGQIPLNGNTLAFQFGIAETLSSMPYIYSIFVNWRTKKTIEKTGVKAKIQEIVMEQQAFKHIQSKPTKCFQLLFILTISVLSTVNYYILYTVSTYLNLIYVPNEERPYNSNFCFELFPLCFVFNTIINIYLQQFTIRRHHVFSLLIIMSGWALILFPHISFESNMEYKLPLCFISNLLSSIQFVGDKWLLDKKYYTPYQLLFFQGITGIVISLTCGSIIELLPEKHILAGTAGTITSMFFNYGLCFGSWLAFVYYVCMIFFNSISSLITMLTRYHYTPFHCNISAAIITFVNWIVILSQGKAITKYIALLYFGHALVIIGILIYTEIIICYVCKLQNNTATEINKRSKTEFMKLMTEVYENDIPLENDEMEEEEIKEEEEEIKEKEEEEEDVK